jgi:4,5-dihydroxyphthalate decarboxylase
MPRAAVDDSRAIPPAKRAGEIDFLPFSFEACRPDLPTVINYALQQSLIPRKIDVEELFDATTRVLRS